MEGSETNINKLQRQIEYYMCDDNLKNDEFFNSALLKEEDRLIPVDLLLNCKKIKQLNANQESLVEAIENSNVLLLSEDKKRFGRRNKKIPVLRRDTLIIVTEKTNDELRKNEAVKELDSVVWFMPYLINFKCDENVYFNARQLEKKLTKQLAIQVPHIKMSKKAGVIVFNSLSTDKEALDQLIEKETLKVNKFELTLRKMTEEETEKWLSKNLKELEISLKIKMHARIFRPINKKADKRDLTKPVELGSKTFKSIEQLKSFMKLCINKTKNGDELKGKNFEVIKALFVYHPTKGSRIEDCVKITVDIHPEYKMSRCFIVETKDGQKEDYSFHKCMKGLIDSQESS